MHSLVSHAFTVITFVHCYHIRALLSHSCTVITCKFSLIYAHNFTNMEEIDVWVEEDVEWLVALFQDDAVATNSSVNGECAVYHLRSLRFPEQEFVAVHRKKDRITSSRTRQIEGNTFAGGSPCGLRTKWSSVTSPHGSRSVN